MKRQATITAIITILILLAAGAAAEKDAKFVAGSKALQFSIDRNFDLNSFQGNTISFKKQTTEDRAMRFGMDLRLQYDKRKNERDYSTGSSIEETETHREGITLRVQRLRYPHPESNVKLYLGCGPEIGFDHQYIDRETSTEPEQRSSRTQRWTRNTTVSAGVRGVIGVEWFVADGISLMAEYSPALSYSYTRSKTSSPYDSKSTTHRVAWSDNPVKLGLSAYF